MSRQRGRIFIVEGPDGAGKTVLARALQLKLDAAYVHQGPYRGDPLGETIRLLERPENRGVVVCDRLHLGEQVYGPVYRGRDALGIAGRRMLERYLLTRDAYVILALPDYAAAHANWRGRADAGGEMFPDEAGFRAVYQGFQEIRTHLDVTVYDYRRTAMLPLLRTARALIGASRIPRILLVGERPGPHGNVHPAAPPFCSRGNSSEWLAERLDDGNVPERALGWLNAHATRTGTRRAPLPWYFEQEERPIPHIVALGREAEAWCRSRLPTVAVRAFAHPQMHKRFRYKQPYPLIRHLQEQLQNGRH